MRMTSRTLPLGDRLSEIQLQTGAEIYPSEHEISTLKKNNYDDALLTMAENRLAQVHICYGFRVIAAIKTS